MTTLADKSLISGGDNKPSMHEKHLYGSWKSIMELYMMNRPHGRMILASVEKVPLVWPSITVDGVTRLKEYTELTLAEAIQADCDIKAINIILQGLPTEIYALVSQHLEKEKQVDTTLIDYAALNQLYKDFSTRFVPQTELSAEQAFWSQNSVNSSEPTLSIRPTNVEVPKELPKVSMVNTSLKKLKHHLANFDVVVKETYDSNTHQFSSPAVIFYIQIGL
ncbi:hypothetical protein Tco_1571900, partial [Tanacetum coccineum]